jgi:hypothetical protein
MKGSAMTCIGNEKGVALVTSLMFTLLALVISMSLLYMVTSGMHASGALKRYRTAVDAAYGGTEIMVKDIISTSFKYNDYLLTNPGTSFPDFLKSSMGTLSNMTVSDCMNQRLTTPRSQWTGACANVSLKLDALTADVTFSLNATSSSPYKIYSKIVDTMERKFLVLDSGVVKTVTIAGNSDTSSIVLEGGSTSEGGGVTVPHYPYMYRIEIQGERATNAVEKSNISVLYAY